MPIEDPNKYMMVADCPHCKISGRHAISVEIRKSRTIAPAVCKHCYFARAGEVERQGPDTRQNRLRDIGRAIRNGDLKPIVKPDSEFVERDTKPNIPPTRNG